MKTGAKTTEATGILWPLILGLVLVLELLWVLMPRSVTETQTDIGPAWSPDCTRIAFDSNRAGSALQVWIMKADGTGLIQLTNTPQLNSSPEWPPNGKPIPAMKLMKLMKLKEKSR